MHDGTPQVGRLRESQLLSPDQWQRDDASVSSRSVDSRLGLPAEPIFIRNELLWTWRNHDPLGIDGSLSPDPELFDPRSEDPTSNVKVRHAAHLQQRPALESDLQRLILGTC